METGKDVVEQIVERNKGTRTRRTRVRSVGRVKRTWQGPYVAATLTLVGQWNSGDCPRVGSFPRI